MQVFLFCCRSRICIDTLSLHDALPILDEWMNGFGSSTFQISGVDMKAESGITPPPRALPRHRMSGTTSQCCTANIFPVRPKIGRDTSELQSRLHLVCRLLLEKREDGAN